MANNWTNQFSDDQRGKIVEVCHKCILTDEGKVGLNYLINERHLDIQTINDFNVGYFSDAIDHQLTGRVIYPLYNVYNDLIAISTRKLNVEKSKSFWHEDFEKKLNLFGINLAYSNIVKSGYAIIVEGELDVMFMHKSGFKETVGIMGTSLSLSQISILARFCDVIFILFDGDSSGKKALKNISQIYYKYLFGKIHLIPCFLEDGMDPDDYILKYGSDKMQELLTQSKKERLING